MDQDYWFTKKSKQFLKNIDTFYYSVYLKEDLTRDSKENAVYRYRCFLDELSREPEEKTLHIGDYSVIYSPGRFSVYNFRFTLPDFFDFFAAPSLKTEKTPAFVLQLRSRPLWEDGVYSAYESSLGFVEAFCKKFGLHIEEVRENRCDFACHSNYLENPEKFFCRDNFGKMWVGQVGRNRDRHRHATFHTVYLEDDSPEDDYISIGQRGDKCFIRIYLKSKEVVEQGYKGWFLKLWQLSGLISRYDFWCLEEAYKRRSWIYLNVARLRWALEYDDTLDSDVKHLLSEAVNNDTDSRTISKLAKKYTRPVTKIFNVEFQCMRDMSKSFELIPKNEGISARVLDYLDNYSLIYEYLTRVSLRLVRPDDEDSNKSRRENTEFWERLRNAKTVDFKKKHKDLKLIRKYNSNVNLEVRKKNAYNALSSFGYAFNHKAKGDIMDDAATLLSILNDNDLEAIDRQKKKLAERYMEDIPDEQKRFRSVVFLYDPDHGDFY